MTTLLAIVVFFSIGWFLQGATRLWVFTLFWTIYLTIVGCGVVFIQLKFFGPVICRAVSGNKRVLLTFDDGPDPVATGFLLDMLAREKIQAVFFCIGKNVLANPELARRILAEGHLIGNHTFNHHSWTPLLGRAELTGEIQKTQEAIEKVTGIRPVFMRPPMGLTNPNYHGVLKRLNLQMMGWDVRSMDTRWPAHAVVKRVLNKTRDGSIILLHDGNSTPQRIEQIVTPIIQELRTRGYTFEKGISTFNFVPNKGDKYI